MAGRYFEGIGRRKNSVVRVRVSTGTGAFTVNEKQIAEVLFGNDWINIKESEKTQLGELLLTVNIDSHRPTRNPEEVLKSAKFLMKRIESIDNQHYNTYKEI